MPKLTMDAWQELRAAHEIGTSFTDLARRFGVSRQAIQKRAKAEGWKVDQAAASEVLARVAVKIATDPAKKDAAIEAVADQVSQVIKLHRSEWQGHRGLFPLKDLAENFEKGKAAKISAEMVALRQRAERAAWGLDNGDESTVEIIIERSYGI